VQVQRSEEDMTIYFIKEGYEHLKCSICKKKFKVGDPYVAYGVAGKKYQPLFRHVACLPPERVEMQESDKKKAPVKMVKKKVKK
jgi:hypothetical protein